METRHTAIDAVLERKRRETKGKGVGERERE